MALVLDYQSQSQNLDCRRQGWLAVAGHLLHPLIVWSFWSTEIYAGHGVGTVGYIVREGTLSAWGTQILLVKAAIAAHLLCMVIIRPLAAVACTWLAAMVLLSAWLTLLREQDLSIVALVCAPIVCFALVTARLAMTVPFARRQMRALRWNREFPRRHLWDILLFALWLIGVLIVMTIWASYHAPDFRKN